MSAPSCLVRLPATLQAGILEALAALGRSLAEEVDPGHFLDEFSRLIREWVPHDRLVIGSVSEDGDTFTIFAEQAGPIGPMHTRHYSSLAHPAARHPIERWGVAPVFRGQTMTSPDLRADPRFASKELGERPLIEAGLRAGIAVPLVQGPDVIGIMVATSLSTDVYTKEHLSMLACLGDVVAPFVHGAMLLQRDRIRRRRMKILERLTAEISGSLKVQEVFGKMASTVREALDFDALSVVLVADDGATVTALAKVDELHPEEPQPAAMPVAAFSFGSRLVAGETVLYKDAPAELASALEGDRWIVERGARSVLCAPLWMGETVGGVLCLVKAEPRWYDSSDAEIGRAVALQIALAIQHQQLADEQRRLAATESRARDLQRRVESLETKLVDRFGFARILGNAPALRAALERATKVAATETTVLITGESGTGKELVARAIHYASARRDGPFVALNCAALPEGLLESELFGHEKGAFTGADRARPGRIEAAAGGTLFLDEVGELTAAAQAKLLRVLQEREFTRVGGSDTRKADVRILAATNRDLAEGVRSGGFREDLYYRLAVFVVHMPPLRERGEDVLLLANHFIHSLDEGMGRGIEGLSPEARQAVLAYSWPGNIRELSNAIERAMILSDGGRLRPDQLGLPSDPPLRAATHASADRAQTLSEVERQMVSDALKSAEGNKVKAAATLGISRSQLYTLLKRHALNGSGGHEAEADSEAP